MLYGAFGRIRLLNLLSTLLILLLDTKTTAFLRPHPLYQTSSQAQSHFETYRPMKMTSDDSASLTVLQQRLVAGGIPPDCLEMYVDGDWARIDSSSEDDEKKEAIDSDWSPARSTAKGNVLEIKTLIWEVTCDGADTYCIVTASKMDDKVHVPSLRSLVDEKNQEMQRGTTCRLSIAPQNVAESLSGFPSGSIPPIGHATSMLLFVDDSIQESAHDDTTIASIGSGVLGKSLLLPLFQFFQFSKRKKSDLTVGSFIQGGRSLSSANNSVSSSGEGASGTPSETRQNKKMQRLDRRPEPKDRLEEYRNMTNIMEKAKLLRSTARKQGRVEDIKALVQEAVKNKEFPQLFKISVKDGMGKNALHVCAWRGDVESVQLMVETAKELYPDLDIVNMISKGMGNYGKTPIFFALTQCREDVVRYLVEQGADLLIVNNKGQTPCSIAVSHLKEIACEYLFQRESQQIKAGGVFKNYRASHSDGKLYGDLDPRFPVDNDNVGIGDLLAQISKFEQSLKTAPSDSVVNGIPTVFEPRSLRPTVRWWVREARSLEEANQSGYCRDGQITFTQPRLSTPKRREDQTAPEVPEYSRKTKDFTPSKNVEELPRLTISEILEDTGDPLDERLVIVNDLNAIHLLEKEADDCINFFSDPNKFEESNYDGILVNSTWGIDCEWKPSVTFGIDNPVSTLQLSTRRKAFLVDLQSMCQDFRENASIPNKLEESLDIVLGKIFTSTKLSIIGFGVLQDLGKLAASFPHLKCFFQFRSVIDLQTVISVVYSKSSRQNMSSLQRIAATLLHRRLDKSQQCSDWTQRPLSKEQLDYAFLDAIVLPSLLEMITKGNSVMEGYNGNFFKIHSNLLSSVRYEIVKTPPRNQEYDVPMGTIKRLLGQDFVRQSWPSTLQMSPERPRLVPVQPETPRVTKKEAAHLKKVGNIPKSQRPKPVQLKTLAGNLNNLPIPGITLGYTKESCVFRVVGHRLLNTFPEGTHIGFNRRAGVVETTNAWILFCNFGTRPDVNGGKTYSDFYSGGRHLTFRLRPSVRLGGSSEASMSRHLAALKRGDEVEERTILLFARDGTRSKYVYCGTCECIQTEILDCGSMSVLLDLLDFEELVGASKISSDFEDLISARRTVAEQVVYRS